MSTSWTSGRTTDSELEQNEEHHNYHCVDTCNTTMSQIQNSGSRENSIILIFRFNVCVGCNPSVYGNED